MDFPSSIRNSYYKESVFSRDQQYYTQTLNGLRRPQGSRRESSLLKSRGNVQQQTFANTNPPQQSLYNPPIIRQMQSKVQIGYPPNMQYEQERNNYASKQQYSAQYIQTLQENKALKRRIDQTLNGSNEFGNTSSVVMMQHYSRSGQEAAIVKEQEQKIKRLQSALRNNQEKINMYKQAADELQLRMGNIQKIDKELYKTLQGSVNRDQELLNKALSGLARGESREEIAKILNQIIGH